MTKARDARTPCAINILCRLSMKDCEGPRCPPPNPPLLLLPPNPPLLLDPPGPYSPPGPYCADTVVATLDYVSWCEQTLIRGLLPNASRAVLEMSFIVSYVTKVLKVNCRQYKSHRGKGKGQKIILNQPLLAGIGLKHCP
jgi:hypothetical protein